MNSIAEYQLACQLERLRTKLAMEVERTKHELESKRIRAKGSDEKIAGYGQAALRGAFLVNGGAAVALLSQLATFSSRIGGEYFAEQVTKYIVVFAIGAAVAVAGTFMSYWTQFEWAELEWADSVGGDDLRRRRGHNLRIVAVSLGIASMLIFVIGVWLASGAMGR